ncbi:MAG: dTDP-4-amino-4,6-dideoxygalactose transaminase [Oligoflexia bacterium]|nr:dTDP-4-amino-4,6-dideoxygalactose transaminase [Oligoflexia bacterium]
MMKIPFNRPVPVGNEEKYLIESLNSQKWSGRGPKTIQLEKLFKEKTHSKHAFFVTSCSSALELSCLLSGIGPGDEVILPSFGFVSAANAVILRRAKPVFADIDLNTWNLSAATVEPLIGSKTKDILTVHYGGSTAGVDDLRKICESRKIFFIEDAAQSLGASRGKLPVGPTPWTSCFSLHDTKNISSGEGGIIATDSAELASRIEIMIEKGTNRQKFFRGEVDKYTWVDVGSSYVASDLLAAVGLAQLEKLEIITQRRMAIYQQVREALGDFGGRISWQQFPKEIIPNGHVLAFRVDTERRDQILSDLKSHGISATFHYVPLHEAPFAKAIGVDQSSLQNTFKVSYGLVRLPIFYDMTDKECAYLIEKTRSVLESRLS